MVGAGGGRSCAVVGVGARSTVAWRASGRRVKTGGGSSR